MVTVVKYYYQVSNLDEDTSLAVIFLAMSRTQMEARTYLPGYHDGGTAHLGTARSKQQVSPFFRNFCPIKSWTVACFNC